MTSTPPSSPAPSPTSLLRSTIIAAAIAALLLVAFVLPAEYGVDVTGVGRVLGLTQMGLIKRDLARQEAAADSAIVAAAAGSGAQSRNAGTQTATRNESSRDTAGVASTHRDSMLIVLRPTQRLEVKLAMRKDQRASYSWQVDTGTVYFNLHGEGPTAPGDSAHSYAKGTMRAASGDIVALFDGVHGWLWYNRSDREIRVQLTAWGEFQELKRM